MKWAHRLFNILLQRKAGIVHPTLIEEINGAVGPNAPGHRGNCVDDKTNAIFAPAQGIFGSLALCNLPSQFFIRRGKLSGSLDDTLFEFPVQPFYILLGLHLFRSFENLPIPMSSEDGTVVCVYYVKDVGRA